MRTNKVKLFEEYNEMATDGKWYVGLADCNGVESFLEEPDMSEADDFDRMQDLGFEEYTDLANKIRKGWSQQVAMLQLRAGANAQRWAVVYRAKLSDDDVEMVESLLADGDYINALNVIKANSITVQLARGRGMNVEKAWKSIPNPELDPFS